MAQRQRHSFALSFVSGSLLAAVTLFSTEVAASAVSTSVFPNSACAGASSGAALVGIGRVTLSNGEVEAHCGCPSDNLPAFEACPSSPLGESVCNSVLDLESGSFTASCTVVPCQGAACPSTVVNTVVVDDADCFATGKGALGISTIDGESKCACSAEGEDFVECPAVANGRASCVSVDKDFLGITYQNKETVQCGVVCDEGFYLTPGGSCTKIVKRDAVVGSPGPIKVLPSSVSHSHKHHHTSSASGHHHHHHHTTSVTTSGAFTTSTPIKVITTTSGSHSHHGHHSHHSSHGHHTSSHGGHHSSSHGHHTSSHGHHTSSHGHHTSSHGHHTSSHGHHTSSHGHHTSVTTSGPATSPTSHHHHSSKSHHGHHSMSAPETTITLSGTPIKVGPSKVYSSHPHAAHHTHTSAPSSHHGHHGHHSSHSGHHTSHSGHHSKNFSGRPGYWSSHMHHSHKPTTSPVTVTTFLPTSTPIKIVTTTQSYGPSQIKVGPGASQVARLRARAAEEFVFGADLCAADERSCAAGDLGDFTCVRLDDVTECGGCNSTGDATNCKDIAGSLDVACLRGGCVVRSCQPGWYQTSEGACARRA